MEHPDHVRLLGGVPQPGSVWADFGSGGGAFTLALAECVGAAGAIHSIDKDKGELDRQRQAMQKRFPAVRVETMHADFTRPIQLPPLDGIVMANSLHFLARKDAVLRLVRGYLQPHGQLIVVEYNVDRGNIWVPYSFSFPTWQKLAEQLIVVEYNVDRGNIWVPYPFSFPTWQMLAEQNGFLRTRLLATQPSHFLGEMYAAVSQVSP